MYFAYGHLISVSLRLFSSPQISREQGENIVVKVTFKDDVPETRAEEGLRQLIEEIDHHHLSDDFGFDSFKSMGIWLDQRLGEMDLKPFKIQIKVSELLSFEF